MSNELQLSNAFSAPVDFSRYANTPVEKLGDGISSGYGIVGYKGKRWSTRYGGDEEILMRDDGDGPRGSIELVILKAANCVSRTWYENGYQEGSSAPPDCMSANGLTPSANSPKKQAASCAVCPRNQFKDMPNGKKGKECHNAKRLAVAPLNDLRNEALGGPMMLRVPGASLTPLKTYGDRMSKFGFPYHFTYGTRISFDPAESYPKFVFSEIRPLTKAELDIVDELRDDPNLHRILDESEPVAPASLRSDGPQWEQNTTGAASSPSAPTVTQNTEAQTTQRPRVSASQATAKKNDGAAAIVSTPAKASASTDSQSTDFNLDEELDALMGE